MTRVKIIFSEGFEDFNDVDKSGVKIVNPLIDIEVPFLPTTFSFGLTLMVSELSQSESVDFKVTIISPDDEEILRINQDDLQVNKNVIINIDLKNLALYTEGIHKIRVSKNDEIILEDAVPVVLIK